ncbi:dihydrofolate reductase [Kocuria dechangensis]|uniref:dihydrofolate reductase n=1 Tax=Kocuria dechangensis TaxID=1176249 RepID=A0A917H5C7_9MICC|nr:dihydrofolate reductase [Kocuria dechangensis]GGG68181.1 dihydrofolate reductase [Kocuria dechangensis]
MAQRPRPVLAAIWAQTPDGVIGKDGGLPWYVPEDLSHFRAVTTGHPVIMGRRTWDSFPPRHRPLTGRTNIVVTTRTNEVTASVAQGAVIAAGSWTQAAEAALAHQGTKVAWVIGGGALYRHALADRKHPVTQALITTIDAAVVGDTFAPHLGPEWVRETVTDWTVSRAGPRYRIDRHIRA